MSSREGLRRFVDLAFPKPCQFGEENFAGDPLVQTFCNSLRASFGLEFHVFITWACPPDVKLLRSRDGSANAIIRSERLDTLLIEYYHQRRCHNLWAEDLVRSVPAAGVLRWICEFLIGYREPELAILAHTLRPDITGIELTNPFRDETLASLLELERTALQCFSIGHEAGHLRIPKQKGVTLKALVDGISLAQHVCSQEKQEASLSDDLLAALADIRERELDAATLLNEVEVDLFALDTVVDFLCQEFSCPIDDAIKVGMLSFECQSFIYGCKGTCRLIARVAAGEISEEEFYLRDYLMGVEIATRARAVARHAGLIWAVSEHPTPPAGGRPYNIYVDRVDTLNRPTEAFRSTMADVLSEQVSLLLAALREAAGDQRHSWRRKLFDLVKQDSELRLDLYYILIAFGCSGAIDVVEYLQQMRNQFHSS
jgi:hypothetical protein